MNKNYDPIDDDNLSSFLKNLFRRLEDVDCHYVALRNYESLPNPAGGDLDLLVGRKQSALFLETCRAACADAGAIFHQERSYQNGHKVTLILSTDGTMNLEIHAQYWVSLELGVLSKALPGVSYKVFLEDIQREKCVVGGFEFFKPSPVDEFALLYRQWIFRGKQKYLKKMNQLIADNKDLFADLPISSEFPTEESALKEFDHTRLLGQFAITRYGRDGPTRYARAFSTRWNQPSTNIPPLIYLSGPDGAGKTTVADLISRILSDAQVPHQRYYSMKRNVLRNVIQKWWAKRDQIQSWRPLLLEDIEDRDTGRKTWKLRKLLNLLFSLVDVFVCSFVVRHLRIRGHAVVIETSPYEVFVKYHMPKFGVLERLIAPMIMRPSLVMILKADAEKICARKNELKPAEIKAYYNRLDSIFSPINFDDGILTLRTDSGLDETELNIFESLSKLLTKKH